MSDSWRLLAQYRVLADDGLVPPLTDTFCGHELTSLLGDDDEPVLYCAMCDTKRYPGIIFWSRIEQAINDNDLGGP